VLLNVPRATRQTLSQVASLADIEHALALAAHEIHTWTGRQIAEEFFTKAIHQWTKHWVWAGQFEKERLFHGFFLGSPARRMRNEKPHPFSKGSTVAVTSSTGYRTVASALLR